MHKNKLQSGTWYAEVQELKSDFPGSFEPSPRLQDASSHRSWMSSHFEVRQSK